VVHFLATFGFEVFLMFNILVLVRFSGFPTLRQFPSILSPEYPLREHYNESVWFCEERLRKGKYLCDYIFNTD